MDEIVFYVVVRVGCFIIVEFFVRFVIEFLMCDMLIFVKSNNGDIVLYIVLKEKYEDVVFYFLSVRYDVLFDVNNDGVLLLYLVVEVGYCEFVIKMLEFLFCLFKLVLMYGVKFFVYVVMRVKRRGLYLFIRFYVI